MDTSSPLYNPDALAREFDDYGLREWERLVATPSAEVSLYIHAHYLKTAIRPGMRVLEIGAGAGRFTQVLAGLGARVLVGDLSQGQLDLNRRFARELGFASAVEDWQQVDICEMSRFADGSFDAVVAYGGPLSYVLDRRDQALGECLRVLKAGGPLLLSVMSLWGSAHAALKGVLELPPEANRRVTDTGDLTPESFPGRKHNFAHMFRAGELRDWLEAHGLREVQLSASHCLSIHWEEDLKEIRADEARWNELLRMELEACADPACAAMGTHLIAVVCKGS